MNKLDVFNGRPADEVEGELAKLMGGDGQYLVIFNPEKLEDGKRMTVVFSNMGVHSTLQSITNYVMEMHGTDDGKRILGDIFEASALGALSQILRERAVALGATLGVGENGGKGDAN